MEFGGESMALAFFCKNRASACVFPFVHDGQEYNQCAKSQDGTYSWCATQTEDDGSRVMMDGMWGPCDESLCQESGMKTIQFYVKEIQP